MTKKEVNEFIERMKEAEDEWTEDEVTRSNYIDMSLEEASNQRLNDLSVMANILATVSNM